MTKPILTSLTALALVAVAACNRAEETASIDPSTNGPVVSDAGSTSGNSQVAVLRPEEAYGVRHERFEEIGDGMKAISRELKGGSPDVSVVQQQAARIAQLAPEVTTWFPAGSGPETNARTRAKAEIWQDEAGIRAAAAQFVEASGAFDRAARSGDVAAIQAALPVLARSCSNCHERFRGPER